MPLNIVSNGIRFEGSLRNTPNGCYAGYNLICKDTAESENYFSDLQGQEEQFEPEGVFITNGILHGIINLDTWIDRDAYLP